MSFKQIQGHNILMIYTRVRVRDEMSVQEKEKNLYFDDEFITALQVIGMYVLTN